MLVIYFTKVGYQEAVGTSTSTPLSSKYFVTQQKPSFQIMGSRVRLFMSPGNAMVYSYCNKSPLLRLIVANRSYLVATVPLRQLDHCNKSGVEPAQGRLEHCVELTRLAHALAQEDEASKEHAQRHVRLVLRLQPNDTWSLPRLPPSGAHGRLGPEQLDAHKVESSMWFWRCAFCEISGFISDEISRRLRPRDAERRAGEGQLRRRRRTGTSRLYH